MIQYIPSSRSPRLLSLLYSSVSFEKVWFRIYLSLVLISNDFLWLINIAACLHGLRDHICSYKRIVVLFDPNETNDACKSEVVCPSERVSLVRLNLKLGLVYKTTSSMILSFCICLGVLGYRLQCKELQEGFSLYLP